LDELPQLWNVFRGDMSLVGPRPVLAKELVEHYGPATQLYIRARPGMTGLWQVSGRSDTSYERRVFLDEWYILNWSFWYDIVILIQTAWIVIARKGAV
jgi:undecaprenyl-phosphate galactose phosphotransferase